jgi:hypothetical protein
VRRRALLRLLFNMTPPNTRRHTRLFLSGFAVLFVTDFAAIISSNNLAESLAFLCLMTINLFCLTRL